MTYKVMWLKEAVEDLQKIKEYYELEAPEVAIKIVQLLYNSAEGLFTMPLARGQKDYEKPAFRRLVINKRFKIFYKVIENRKLVEIWYIRHTAQMNNDF